MTEADVTCVVCRSPDTVGPSKLYCGDHEPVGHRDERPDPVAEYYAARREALMDLREYMGEWRGEDDVRCHQGIRGSTPTLSIFDETRDGWRSLDVTISAFTWTEQWP